MDLVVELPRKGQAADAAPVRYRAVSKLGGGSFGDILAAVSEEDPDDWTALKIEARYKAENPDRSFTQASMVRFEREVCSEVARCAVGNAVLGGVTGQALRRSCPCPMVRGWTSLFEEHDVVAMELLGPNLRDYATALGHWPLPQDLVLLLGAVLLGRLEQLHSCGFVHRDLKPENIVLRLDHSPGQDVVPCLVLVDYALAMRFSQPGGADHIAEHHDPEGVVGTHRYMAIHAQKGVTQSRRSDLESLAHVLIYLALSKLPWQDKQDMNEMVYMKESLPIETLCAGLRPEFAAFLRACRALQFRDAPDYAGLRKDLVRNLRGPLDFQLPRVLCSFTADLQNEYLRRQALRVPRPLAPLSPRSQGFTRTIRSTMSIFARQDPPGLSTELVAGRPPALADLDNPHSFSFEGCREPLPGTVHVVVGACHFFGFLTQHFHIAAHQELGLPPPPSEQILVFSHGNRDWVARSSSLRDYDPTSGRPYQERNLRAAFWSSVLTPRAAQVRVAG